MPQAKEAGPGAQGGVRGGRDPQVLRRRGSDDPGSRGARGFGQRAKGTHFLPKPRPSSAGLGSHAGLTQCSWWARLAQGRCSANVLAPHTCAEPGCRKRCRTAALRHGVVGERILGLM